MVFCLKAKIVDMETGFLNVILKKKYSRNVHQKWQMLKRIMSLHWINVTMVLDRWQHSIIRRPVKLRVKLDSMVEMLIHQYQKGVAFVAIYMDDNLMVGHLDAIDDTIEQWRKMYLLSKWKVIWEATYGVNFGSALIEQNMVRTTLSFGKFGKIVWERCSLHERNQDPWNSKCWNFVLYKWRWKDFIWEKVYCSGVEILLYLVKHLCPDNAHAVRELS